VNMARPLSGDSRRGCAPDSNAASDVRILLVDDHPEFRASLERLLSSQAGLAVVAQADEAAATIGAVARHRPDIAVVDVQMPRGGGVGLTRLLALVAPAVPVLALSSHDAPAFVEAMRGAGARGYMLKDDPFEELAHAIREIAAGRRYLSRALASAFPELSRKF